MIDPDVLGEMTPALDTSQVLAAKWTPGDGQLSPFKLVYGLLEDEWPKKA